VQVFEIQGVKVFKYFQNLYDYLSTKSWCRGF